MAEHNESGKEAEQLGAEWLREQGYEILHVNWRYSYFEIDIVAEKGDTLHIVEVKSRTSNYFGYPEESVGKRKFKKIQRAADQYIYLFPKHKWLQYDILAITMNDGINVEYFLLEDVFL